MNIYKIQQKLKYTFAGALLMFFSHNKAQQDTTYTNIQVVRITKLSSKENNKDKISVKETDVLHHDAGAFLNSIPEINAIRKAGNYASDPVVRGFKYEQLNIVIDGAANAVNACPSRMDPAISQINVNEIQEAEIYKGPYHFRHGSSIGGSINFITKLPNFSEKLQLNGRFSSGFESNGNIYRNEAVAGISNSKIVWDFFGSYQKGDRYKDGNGNEVRSAFLRYNVGSKLNYQWNKSHVTTLQINSNQGRDVEFAALNMDLIYDKTWMFQMKHLSEFTSKRLKYIDFNTYLSLVDHSMGTPDKKMISDVKSMSYGSRAEWKFNFNKTLLFTGIDYKRDAAENIKMMMPATMPKRDGTAWQDSYVENFGWFNELQYPFSKSKIFASLRLDYNKADAKLPSVLFQTKYANLDSQMLNHNLSFGYHYSLNNHSQIAIWLGRAQRSGSLTERFINRFVVGNDAYEMIGNPQLKPETNNQTDIVFTYKKDHVYFQGDVFYSYMQNYISGVVIPLMPYSMMSPGTRQFQNLEKALRTGAEARFNWKFLPKYKTEMAVAYTYAKDLNTQLPLPEIAPLDFRWNVEADFTPVQMGIYYRFSAKQERVNPQFKELQTPEFSVFDIAAKLVPFKNSVLKLMVHNVFNRAYAEHLNRTFSTNKAQRILAPGRNFSLAFSYQF